VDDRAQLAEAIVLGTATARQWAEAAGPHGVLAYTLHGPCPNMQAEVPESVARVQRMDWRCLAGTCRHGELKQAGIGDNLITDAGDLYIIQQVRTGVAPANAAAPVRAIGMKLGTGTTAVAKNGAGGALVTYTTGSHRAFDAGNPTEINNGAGLGDQISYVTTYPAGVVTVSGLAEAIIALEATLTDATNTAATTASRGLLSPVVNKGAQDTLTITWTWRALGA
jgi:hypothetical protein